MNGVFDVLFFVHSSTPAAPHPLPVDPNLVKPVLVDKVTVDDRNYLFFFFFSVLCLDAYTLTQVVWKNRF